MRENPTDEQMVTATRDAVSCEFGKGLALFDVKSNVYYSLNGVGAYIWHFIQQPRSTSEICEAVLSRYKVEPARCKADVEALLKGLAKAGLIRLHHEELV
jgi:hypothetical protein